MSPGLKARLAQPGRVWTSEDPCCTANHCRAMSRLMSDILAPCQNLEPNVPSLEARIDYYLNTLWFCYLRFALLLLTVLDWQWIRITSDRSWVVYYWMIANCLNFWFKANSHWPVNLPNHLLMYLYLKSKQSPRRVKSSWKLGLLNPKAR